MNYELFRTESQNLQDAAETHFLGTTAAHPQGGELHLQQKKPERKQHNKLRETRHKIVKLEEDFSKTEAPRKTAYRTSTEPTLWPVVMRTSAKTDPNKGEQINTAGDNWAQVSVNNSYPLIH